MARFRDIADDLRRRIGNGEYALGDKLPPISDLMEEYEVPGLNTIRAAQQLLVDEGLLETRQGIGAFVVATRPQRKRVDLLHELKTARDALNRAIDQIERASREDTAV